MRFKEYIEESDVTPQMKVWINSVKPRYKAKYGTGWYPKALADARDKFQQAPKENKTKKIVDKISVSSTVDTVAPEAAPIITKAASAIDTAIHK